MKEFKKVGILIGALMLVILLFVAALINDQKQKQKAMDSYLNAIEKKGTNLIYIGREGCSYCQQFAPVIAGLSSTYGFKYTYVDTDKITEEQLSKIITKLDVDSDSFGTPTIAVTKDGKSVDSNIGALDREGLFDFLQKNGVISKDETLKDEYANLSTIDYSKYEKILEDGNRSVVVIGQTGCTYCEQAKPILNEIANEYDVTINYLNLTDLSEDESKDLFDSLEYLKKLESVGTPLTLVIKDKKVVGHLDGAQEKESFVKFFKENKMIGE